MLIHPPARAAASLSSETGSIDRVLALGDRLLASFEANAIQLGLPDFGAIELPPAIGSAVDQSRLQIVPPLYLAAELEAARLVPAVEVLAGLAVSGGLSVDLGEAAPRLAGFWQRRHSRFTADERRAFFGRLFGNTDGPALALPRANNTEFESRMIDVCEALYKLYPDVALVTLPPSTAHLQTAASTLASDLAERSGGLAMFAARDVLNTIKDALGILQSPPLQSALGAHSVWGAVQNVATTYLRETVDIPARVTRGKSGVLVLAWLSQIVTRLDDMSGQLVSPQDPVIGAATAWLQASLALHENLAADHSRGS